MYQEGSRTRFGIISLLKKRSSLLKPLKSEKEPFFTALFHFMHFLCFFGCIQRCYAVNFIKMQCGTVKYDIIKKQISVNWGVTL